MDDTSLVAGAADDRLSFDLLAASLRSDAVDQRAYLTALATKLEGALPAQTSVKRARDSLFSSTTHVERVSIDLGAWRYLLVAGKRGGLEATRAKIVGGVTIKNETIPIDAWIDGLARDLATYAASNTAARAALERLVL